MNTRPLDILSKFYGYKNFRRGQAEIINSIIDKKDVVAIMPTGGGKSICYQIPALVFDGLTIVISPLISLMKDQVDALNEIGVKAGFINSSLTAKQFGKVLNEIKNDELKLIYIAPERLDSDEFINLVWDKNISQVAIDEAHCVSQWGHDFRLSYREIPKFIKILKSKPVVTAFTATASNEVREDIERLLLLEDPECFITGFNRENLTINIVRNSNKRKYMLDYIQNHKSESGIVYAATRKEVEKIHEILESKGFSVARYHAGLGNKERTSNQVEFIKDDINIMVATNAFGMGIDKPNIRWVIHYNMPQSIENYYQEIGRAGRDGEKSECILMFTPGDIQVQKYLIDLGIDNPDRKLHQHKKLQQMIDLVYTNSCYRKNILAYFGENLEEDCGNCSNCLNSGEMVDKTVDAQKVISCIYRMKKSYGITTIVDVLRGSKNKKVLQFGFDKLSTYNIMKDYSSDDLKTFINTLVSHGYLDMVESLGSGGRGSFPTIKLNDISMDILKGNIQVEFKEDVITEVIEVKDELYESLRELRKKISVLQKIAPYMVFGDGTLKSMSMKMPTTQKEMLNISGVGQVKYEKYGEQFENVIREYIDKNGIGRKVDKKSLEEDILNDEEAVKKKLSSKRKSEKVEIEDEFFRVESNKVLYDVLDIFRKKCAEKERSLPSMVLSKDTIKEISGRYPINQEQLSDIAGIGPTKVKKYGKSIINIVKEYIDKNSIDTLWTVKKRKTLILDGESRKKNEIALDLLNQGQNVEEVGEFLETSQSTVLGYVHAYLEEGNNLTFDLDINGYYDEQEKEMILDMCSKHGDKNLNILKRKLPDNIKYETIRAVLLDKLLEDMDKKM
ncbi:DNA helicase RecQ [Metaclostridioides mangenotii]|uniref:DNA helicase RecQ n=1 Tax=Metaclostridioides mangenotii TaxID=1540 RepID=UPI00048622BA|nr:DNA helicase RecQ [Clostridioides mangenotii]